MNVLVTGANGFVGSALIPRLLEAGHHVTALVRSKPKKKHPKVKYLQGDLLLPKSLPDLADIEKAYYLVHGLKADDENFEYHEAKAAVHFINWIRPTGAGIIYLGGLGPAEEELSPHLRSRHLTGAILGASGLSTLEFRASIVLGEGSLSFEMIKAIGERLPFIPELSLLSRPCQPISLPDLLKYLERALDYTPAAHEILEIGGPDVKTYGELIELYTELAGHRRKRVRVPDVDANVLIKALDYSIPEHSHMGKKLTESLEFATVVQNNRALTLFSDIKPEGVRVAMDLAQSNSETEYAPLWEKDFLKSLLNDKILTQSGLLSPELLKNLERVGKLRSIFSRKK